MGMSRLQILGRVELPLALPLLFTGIRVAAVTVVATAPIAAIAGGGGLGDVDRQPGELPPRGRARRLVLRDGALGGSWLRAAGVTEGDHAERACARLGSGVRTDKGSSCDPEAHPQGCQGGVRDFARGRDRPRRYSPAPPARRQKPGPTIVIGTKNFAGGVHPRRALQAGARRRRASPSRTRGASARPKLIQTALTSGEDQLLSRVHGRDRAGRLPRDVLRRDRSRDDGERTEARGGEGLHRPERDAVLRHRRRSP